MSLDIGFPPERVKRLLVHRDIWAKLHARDSGHIHGASHGSLQDPPLSIPDQLVGDQYLMTGHTDQDETVILRSQGTTSYPAVQAG